MFIYWLLIVVHVCACYSIKPNYAINQIIISGSILLEKNEIEYFKYKI